MIKLKYFFDVDKENNFELENNVKIYIVFINICFIYWIIVFIIFIIVENIKFLLKYILFFLLFYMLFIFEILLKKGNDFELYFFLLIY